MKSLRLYSPLSSHVTLNKSLTLSEPSFLNLQREPLPPLTRGSWENKWKTKYPPHLEDLLTQEGGKRPRAAGAPRPCAGEAALWAPQGPAVEVVLLTPGPAIPQPSAQFPKPCVRPSSEEVFL